MRSRAPASMAISAKLKMPVRNDPMPTFKKSVTRPSNINRSIRLLIPPPAINARGINLAGRRRRAKSDTHTKPINSTVAAAVNRVKRICSDSESPRLKNAPGFCTSCRRSESANSDSVMPDDSKARAADFDTWSHPTQQHNVTITTMNLGIDRMDDSSCQTSSDLTANEKVQNFCLRVKISHHRRQSPIRLKPGYLNVAGLLCSKKKCPTQANA